MSIQSIGQSYSTYQVMNLQNTQGGRGNFAPPQIDAETIIETEDANLDGVLTLEETQLTEDMFADADTDESGELSYEELEAMLEQNAQNMAAMQGGGPGGMGGPPPGPPPSIDELFETEDTDESGTISASESALASEMFDSIDADGDGELTAEEIEASRPEKPEFTADTQQTGSSASAQTLNEQLAITAYQNAMQSLISFESDSDDSWGSGYFSGVFA